MIKLTVLFAFILLIELNASILLDTKVYERKSRVDILLMFDTPYEGVISQKKEKSGVIITLSEVSIKEYFTKHVNSQIINGYAIKNSANGAKVFLYSKNKFDVLLSKTNDGYGLRVRTKPSTPIAKDKYINPPIDNTQNIDAMNLDSRYYIALATLVFIIIALYILKRFILNSNSTSWLIPNEMKDSKVIFQKGIDNSNKIVLYEYKDKRYLMLVGSSNILLDAFKEKTKTPDTSFEQEFISNKQKIDEYLKLSSKQKA